MKKLDERKKLLIYKILLFVFAFAVAFLPATASRNLEVNSRVVVEMLGVDGTDKGIEVTAQYVMPTETDGATTKDKVSVEGETLTEAVELLNTALGRRAELGQCSVVVVGSELDPNVLGTLMTATDVTADVYLTAATDKAKDLVGDMTDFMKKSGATDADFIAYSAKKAHIATVTLLNFLSDLDSASGTAFIPVVEMLESGSDEQSGQESEGSSKDGGGGSGSASGGGGACGGGEQSGMKVEKLALYVKDGRAAVLEAESARGVAWVSAPIEKGIVTADVTYRGDTVEAVSARLLKKCAEISADAKNDRATVRLKATLEPNGDKFNLLDAKGKDASNAIKSAFADKIRGEIEQAFSDARAVKTDPLFIGRTFYRYSPDYFSSDYSLEKIKVDFDVTVELK